MRPVNLIPNAKRRGESAPLRTGYLSYAIVAVLLLALGGVVAMVLTGNKISDSQAQVASLEARQAAAQQRASDLAPYTDFANLEQARKSTVTQLAQSRFDWERVLREMAIVIPHNVWLTSLSGSVDSQDASGNTSSSTASSSSLTGGVTGPSLNISGCATSKTAVAAFLSSLRDIDGVTRVGLQSTTRSAPADATSSAAPSGGGGTCSGSRSLESFSALATFDSVPTPSTTDPSTAAPTITATSASVTATSTTGDSTTSTTASTAGNTSTTPASTATTPSTSDATATTPAGGAN